jgi:hypothetical protein
MRRRDFITLFGVVTAWPLAAQSQQGPIRRIGALMPESEGGGRTGHCATKANRSFMTHFDISRERVAVLHKGKAAGYQPRSIL